MRITILLLSALFVSGHALSRCSAARKQKEPPPKIRPAPAPEEKPADGFFKMPRDKKSLRDHFQAAVSGPDKERPGPEKEEEYLDYHDDHYADVFGYVYNANGDVIKPLRGEKKRHPSPPPPPPPTPSEADAEDCVTSDENDVDVNDDDDNDDDDDSDDDGDEKFYDDIEDEYGDYYFDRRVFNKEFRNTLGQNRKNYFHYLRRGPMNDGDDDDDDDDEGGGVGGGGGGVEAGGNDEEEEPDRCTCPCRRRHRHKAKSKGGNHDKMDDRC